MPAQVILHEGRDEIIAVALSFTQVEREVDARRIAGRTQQFRAQFRLQEAVGRTPVRQQGWQARTVLDQGDTVMLPPDGAIGAEIAGQRLLPHGTCDGATMGAKADTALKRPGLLRARPPIERPRIDWRSMPAGKFAAMRAGSSAAM